MEENQHGNRNSEEGLSEEELRLQEEIDRQMADISGLPADQQQYNTALYGQNGQNQNQTLADFYTSLDTGGPRSSNPADWDLDQSMMPDSNGPSRLFRPAPPPPGYEPLVGSTTASNSMRTRSSSVYRGTGNSFAPNTITPPPNLFRESGRSNTSRNFNQRLLNNETTDAFAGETGQYPYPIDYELQGNSNPPQVPYGPPPQLGTQPSPRNQLLLTGELPTQERRGLYHHQDGSQSTSGPLDPERYRGFPAQNEHQELLFEGSLELERQLLFYVDVSPQRRGESWNDYTLRWERATLNMRLEIRRRPAMPSNMTRQEQRRWLNDVELTEQEHREMLNRSDGEAYNPQYEDSWRAERVAMQGRNAQRRAVAVERLRREYAKIGFPGFPDPPDPEDSGDELYTHDEFGRLRPPREGGNSQANGGPSYGGSTAPPRSLGTTRHPNRGGAQNFPRNAGGQGPPGQGREQGQSQGEDPNHEYSTARCLPCGSRSVRCSIQATGFPCETCVRTGREEECVPLPLKKRGNQPGSRRGRYKKSEAFAQRQEEKAKSKAKVVKGKRARKVEEVDEGEGDEDEGEALPPPPSSQNSRRKRDRESILDDDQEDDEQTIKKRRIVAARPVATTRSAARNTTNPPQVPSRTPNNQSSGAKRSIGAQNDQQVDPFPDACSNCRKHLRICTSTRRPCSQYVDNNELDCDGAIIGLHNVRTGGNMRTPIREELRVNACPTPTSVPSKAPQGASSKAPPRMPPGGAASRPPSWTDDPFSNSFGQFVWSQQDTEMPDVRVPPLRRLLEHARTTVSNATAQDVLSEASGEWRGGREPGDANPEADYRRTSQDDILDAPEYFGDAMNGADANKSQNGDSSSSRTNFAIDPALLTGPAQNPALPAYAGALAAQAPQAAQQAQNPNGGASPDWLSFCDEPSLMLLEKCGKVPTKPCDNLTHAFYNVCEPCVGIARKDMDGLGIDWADSAVPLTQQHMCSHCADDVKKQVIQDPECGVQARQCLCIGQVKMAWLCAVHRDDALNRVYARAGLQDQRRVSEYLYGKCPVCNVSDSDANTEVWICAACGETVVGP